MSESIREATQLSLFRAIEEVMGQALTLDKHHLMPEFLESVPAALVQNRKFSEIVATDLLDLYAHVVKDAQEDDLTIDAYLQLLQYRYPDSLSRDDAKTMLKHHISTLKNEQGERESPTSLRITKDVRSMVQVHDYLKGCYVDITQGFGEICFSNNALVVHAAANAVIDSIHSDNGKNLLKNSGTVPVINDSNSNIAPALLALLSKNTTNMINESADLDEHHGRNDDVKRLSRVLLQKKGASALLHGDEGIGKSTVVKALAKNMAEGNGPGQMKTGTIFKINLADMLYKDSSKIKKTLDDIMTGVSDHNSNNPKSQIVLYVDDFGSVPANELRDLISYKASRENNLHLIVSATEQEMFLLKKTAPALLAPFETLKLEELPAAIAMNPLQTHAKKLSDYHSVEITQDALDHIAEKTDRYMPNAFRPGKGIGVLLSAVAESELNNEPTLSTDTIDTIIAEKTGLPLALIGGSASDRIENLGEALSQRIFGQEEAVSKISKTIGLVNRNLHDPKKPLGVFYLTGASGVGKSELAKSLSQSLFADEKALITVNLADFADKHTVSRIVGAPPGYLGYGEETALETVEKKPFSVVLFDEAEKAHPEVDNALMKIMDEGELTLLNGKKLNFRNCVLIFTSNLGASAAQNAADEIGNRNTIGFTQPSAEDKLKDADKAASTERMRAAKERLKPEFRNRATFIDMNNLTPDVVKTIALKKIDDVSTSLRQNKLYAGLTVKLSDNALDELMGIGFDAKNGARPMDRAIRDYVKVPLADWLKQNETDLAGETKTLTVDSVKDSFTVTATATAANQNKVGAPQSGSTRKPGGPTAQPA
ncbi:AAA family ATPase [Micavibrio aeruginosavorus]|uniref:AAA family ATPase n=1 Tax=Micavibrio aeruginosavorus TaxID=349221 RepID=UPI003F4A92DE